LTAAALLTGCSTSAPTFHLVGTAAVASKAVPGEQQLFAGDHTFAANDTSNVADLRWAVTTGPGAATGNGTPVTTADGEATLTVAFAAAADTKAIYRVCLSSIASPATTSCQVYAVGGTDIWNGQWGNPILPGPFKGTQTGDQVSLSIIIPHQGEIPGPTGPLTSPFLLEFQPPGGPEVWLEWGTGDIVTYSRDGVAVTLTPTPTP
jgi:hypothetical protein